MLKAYINDIAYELEANFSITEQAANKTASDFTVLVTHDLPIPKSGDTIEIKESTTGEIYFLGMCGIPKSPKYKSPFDVRRYTITCGNANSIMSRRIVNVAFKEYTITQIVEALFYMYISQEGFTLGEISDIPITLEVYTAGDYNLQFCLNELAEFIQGSWYCTNERQFFFLAKDDFDEFPEVIEGDFIPITDLQVAEKDTEVRTSQIISGGQSQTLQQTDTKIYDGDENNFVLSFNMAIKPQIYVRGDEVPPEIIGIRGQNDGNPNIMFLYALESNVVTYNNGYSGTAPFPIYAGEPVTFLYVGFFPIRVEIRNQAAITEIAQKTRTSGIIENVRLDKSVNSLDDAKALGDSLLETYSKNRNEIKGWISVKEAKKMGLTLADFDLLKKWTFNLPEYGAVGEYVMVERTIAPFILDTASEDNLKITMKLVDRAFMKSYAETLNDLSKAITQLSIRRDDIIIDVQNDFETVEFAEHHEFGDTLPDTDKEEFVRLTETKNITEYSDFFPLYCCAEADGILMCPQNISFVMFSDNDFGEEHQYQEQRALSEIIEMQSDTDTETDREEARQFTELISVQDGGVETEPSETRALSENITTTEGQLDTAPTETRALTEQTTVNQDTDFVILYCTSEAQFLTDGQIASPTGLLLYAFNSAIGG